MSLDNLKKKVTAAVEDVITLEVASFTGKDIKLQDANKTPKEVFATIKSSLTSSTLVGYSRFEFDGDAMNYLNSDLGEDKNHLVDKHIALVESAQKSRQDFVSLVKDIF